MGAVEARLIALDAKTGKPCENFGAGVVKIEPSLQLCLPGEFQITSAPAIVNDTVVTGSAIAPEHLHWTLNVDPGAKRKLNSAAERRRTEKRQDHNC